VSISSRPSARRSRVNTTSSAPRAGVTRVGILATYASFGSSRASHDPLSLRDKGIEEPAQELTFYFRSPPHEPSSIADEAAGTTSNAKSTPQTPRSDLPHRCNALLLSTTRDHPVRSEANTLVSVTTAPNVSSLFRPSRESASSPRAVRETDPRHRRDHLLHTCVARLSLSSRQGN